MTRRRRNHEPGYEPGSKATPFADRWKAAKAEVAEFAGHYRETFPEATEDAVMHAYFDSLTREQTRLGLRLACEAEVIRAIIGPHIERMQAAAESLLEATDTDNLEDAFGREERWASEADDAADDAVVVSMTARENRENLEGAERRLAAHRSVTEYLRGLVEIMRAIPGPLAGNAEPTGGDVIELLDALAIPVLPSSRGKVVWLRDCAQRRRRAD